MKRSRIISIFVVLLLLFSGVVLSNKVEFKIMKNIDGAYCIVEENETIYWSWSGKVNISIWDTGEDPVSPDNYTLVIYNDDGDNVTQFFV